MIKAENGYFEMKVGDENEVRKDFGTICISLMKEGFTKETLIELVGIADKIIKEHGDEII